MKTPNEKIAKLEQWKDDLSPIIKEMGKDIKKLNWKLAVATGIIIAVNFAVSMDVELVQAFNKLF